MNGSGVLVDAFGRAQGIVHDVVAGLDPEYLTYQVAPRANSIAWLVWHLTRVQDDHVADVAETEQVWIAQGWVDRFGLPYGELDTGFGHSAEDVAAAQVSPPTLLTDYYDAVHEQTVRYVKNLRDADLGQIIDEAWSPPVTLGARLVSVAGEGLQHGAQAAFIRGIAERTR